MVTTVDWNRDEIGKGGDFPRFVLLGGLISKAVAAGEVLDVGCDTANLRPFVGTLRYTGLDSRDDAISSAKEKFPGCAFVCADAEIWQPTQTFDAIVFNESLYYLKNVVGALHKYAASLRDGGILAISIYRRSRWFGPNRAALLASKRFLQDGFRSLYDVTHSSDGATWTILMAKNNWRY